jgi:hypothetical protein
VQRVHHGQNDVQSSEGKSPVAQYCDSGLRSFFVYRDAGLPQLPASISVRGSFTLSTIGRTTWSSRRSSLPADFATTEITPSAIAEAAPPTVGH